MTAATLRLERFDLGSLHSPTPPHSPEALNNAFEEGYRQGQEDVHANQMAALTEALLECAEKLADDDLIRASARQDVARALGPLLDAIIEKICPSTHQDQISAFLEGQLGQQATASDQSNCVVRCPPDIQLQAAQILKKYELTRIRLEPALGTASAAEVVFNGGSAIFDPDATISLIRQLADDTARELSS